MQMKLLIVGTSIVTLSALAIFGTTPILREERTVPVGPVAEQWRLEWRSKPAPACGPRDDSWGTCPCLGFAFGEMGLLDLVRKRPGHPEERLELTPYFKLGENPGAWALTDLAVLQRWPVLDGDHDSARSASFAERVESRALTPSMVFGDYDHDGRATEFVLQVGTEPCGHSEAIVVGLSRRDSSLHALASVAHPQEPLVLQRSTWDRLLHTSGEAVDTVLTCGDHASGQEIDVHLRATAKGIVAARFYYDCTAAMKRGAFLYSKPL